MERTSPMKNSLPRIILSPWLYHCFRLFIGGLFLYTGVIKLADVAGFAESIAAYGILPAILLPCAAFGLPALEVVTGFGTLLNRRWAILGILAMMILFTGVLGYGVAVGLEIDCGCFSTDKKAAAQKSEPAGSILDIPQEEGSLFDENIILIEPVQEDTAKEEVCAEGEAAATKTLWPEFIRDIFLLIGVLYLVAWPDLRRRFIPISHQTR